MIRGSFFTSSAARFSFAALLSTAAGVTALTGCTHEDGGPCQYEPAGTITYTVTAIGPGTTTAAGKPCSVVSIKWASGATPDYPHGLYGTEACLAAAGVEVGSSVEISKETETSGTCDPEGWTIVDQAVDACNSACAPDID